MLNTEKFKFQLKRLKNNQEGSFGIIAGVSMLMLVLAIGTAIDVSLAFKARAKLQATADTVGLMSSIYVRDNDESPRSSDEGFMDDVKYDISAANFGQPLDGVTGDFSVNYNDQARRSEVEVKGKIKTTFLGAFNKSSVDINVKSTVQYYETAQAATSVFLVVDNSGSMAWDDIPIVSSFKRPTDAKTRISGLQSTVTKFNTDLNTSLSKALKNSKEKYLRTALIPYSTDTITNKVSGPDWGTVNNGAVSRMRASGGTDSRGPLTLARTLMKSENNIHYSENGTKDPNKYVIFMTDGANNEEWVCDWRDRRRTRLWRRYNGYKYEYANSRRSPGNGWSEGVAYNCRQENNSNRMSVSVCNQLKNEGVEVFTVGFALEPGTYFADAPRLRSTATIAKSTTDSAYDFLKSCASSEDQFLIAKDSDALDVAFEKIGKKIAQDSIRISS
ncbi:TadE/TadG family type IV pilus assembly protein [Hellea balneolensis]|uniref:TadE/TadG family type IV pilus assembly protein n=1 Tax=Hellea balneolensis TaxID=287478 RepID=UPI00047C4945|nr:TadE/TadG family type IV pilus assembly protein [Hellea balneolensis]